MATWSGPSWLQRAIALGLALVAVPMILGISVLLQEAPVREGEPSPRTIVASQPIRVVDPEATERERRQVAEAVQPVLVDDDEATAAIVQQVRDSFARARAAREPDDEGRSPTRLEQIEALEERLPMLDDDGVRALVSLTDDELNQVSSEAVSVAQQFARQRIRDGEVEQVLDDQLPTEVAVRSFPSNVATTVVAPIIRDAVRPTVAVDEQATTEARQQAEAEVADVVRSWTGGQVIVAAGETVDEVQLAALRERGLQGAEPWQALLRAFGLAAIITLAVASYLRAYRVHVWRNPQRLVLLALLFALFTVALETVSVLAPAGSGWLYVIPVGAIAMLATILFDPPIGVLSTIPITALVAFTTPGDPGMIVFTGAACLLSVPMVSRLSARGDLRRAAGQSTLVYVGLAGAMAALFGPPESIPVALAAGLVNGLITAMIVNGLLPFLESVFGVVTATSLLDLADRNHPLLRELEQKALGSYNHSIMVSTMVERAARRIDADALLGSVAALYHDIGKVQRPYFFIENQFGIDNPHDGIPPQESAIIIQNHVTDGVSMARSHRLPPEVVEGIATHHGTTLVKYFHQQALEEAKDPSQVDESHFRYKGRKPAAKEMAILMLADCCESAARAAALHDRNLSKEDLEEIVYGLVADRVEDGQLDESALTFRELSVVQDTFIETLVGVYHPRIAYPKGTTTTVPKKATGKAAAPAPPPDAADSAVSGGDGAPTETAPRFPAR